MEFHHIATAALRKSWWWSYLVHEIKLG